MAFSVKFPGIFSGVFFTFFYEISTSDHRRVYQEENANLCNPLNPCAACEIVGQGNPSVLL